MASTPEVQVEEEISKAQAWYHETFGKKFEVIRRYDKFEKKWEWQFHAYIGGATRVSQIGLTAEVAEGPLFRRIVPKLLPYIRTMFVKAHAKYEPAEIVNNPNE